MTTKTKLEKQITEIYDQSEATHLLKTILSNSDRLKGITILCDWMSGASTISTTCDTDKAIRQMDVASRRLQAALDEEDE